MFERYTEHARRTIFFARFEASRLGSPYIMPEHLLLGVIRESPEVRSTFIDAKSDDEIRRRIEEALGKGTALPTSVDLPLNDSAKRALAYAAEESERLKHWHINEIHLMLGLLHQSDTLVAQIILDHGMTADALREIAAKYQSGPQVLPMKRPFDAVIDSAKHQAELLGQSPDLEHLLAAILMRSDSLAAKILQRHGMTLESLREELKKRKSEN